MKINLKNNLKKNMKINFAHYGDMIAIPFFIVTLYYFLLIERKTYLEILIIVFLCIALLWDIASTCLFFTRRR